MKSFLMFLLPPLVCAIPAFAQVTITSPTSSSKVVSPFSLIAAASSCNSQRVSSMAYSVDSSRPTRVNGSSINTKVSASTEAHVVNVTAYGSRGAECNSSVAITVVPDPATQVPSTAQVFKSVQNINEPAPDGWQGVDDTGVVGGSATGTTTIVSRPSLSGSARQFVMQFTNSGAERFSVVFDPSGNTSATNFLYDGWIYLARPSNGIANIETDVDQVLSSEENGDTVIYGFQCDGYSGTWDYTTNAAQLPDNSAAWEHSSDSCNPQSWSTNTWHHLQIAFSRDQSGNVTYQSVWFDGVEQDLYATVPSAFNLDWGSVLLTNFEIDGYGASGSATVYLDNLTISCW